MSLVNDCVHISFLQDIVPSHFESTGSPDLQDPAHIDFLSKNPNLLMLLQIGSVLPQKGIVGQGRLDNIRNAIASGPVSANFKFLRDSRCPGRLYVPRTQIIEELDLRCLSQLRNTDCSPTTVRACCHWHTYLHGCAVSERLLKAIETFPYLCTYAIAVPYRIYRDPNASWSMLKYLGRFLNSSASGEIADTQRERVVAQIKIITDQFPSEILSRIQTC
ncbi:hypothetical protein B0H13DRAFT_2119800 [Mycena leptocephala]|nr:hypothetical protein B0H13DRAFT_2119800 [Mycena leptocephala]